MLTEGNVKNEYPMSDLKFSEPNALNQHANKGLKPNDSNFYQQ